jgi:hypothetical protein
MTNPEMIEYTAWMLADAGKQLLQAVAIYVVPISAYWIFVG